MKRYKPILAVRHDIGEEGDSLALPTSVDIEMYEMPNGGWVKWEDIRSSLMPHEIETLDDIVGMYRQEFGAEDYRYVEAKKVIEKLRGKI